MELKTLHDLLVDQLKDLYSAENQLVKALPKMAKKAANPKLRAGFEGHLEETKGQFQRLEQISELLDISLKNKKCAAMEGLIEEGAEIMAEKADPDVKDAGLIAAAQKVEHYEIASYGTVCTWAKQLGLEDVAKLLGATLAEEKATDEKLTQLAEAQINQDAETPDNGAEMNGHSGKGRKKKAAVAR